MASVFLLAALGLSSLAAANTPIAPTVFVNDPATVALAGAPLWFLDSATCFPSPAVNADGTQNGGNAPDNCNELKIHHNCPAPPKQNGANTEAGHFPTYNTVRYCAKDDSWRVAYDVYFTKDTGHRHDWEWATLKWLKNSDGNYIRDGMWFEEDGKTPYKKWGDIISTFNGNDDKLTQNVKGLDHAQLYFGKFHHPVFDSPHTSSFANTCPPNSADDYRSNDYFVYSADNMVSGLVIPPEWTWGSADSYPANFEAGKKHDLCNLS